MTNSEWRVESSPPQNLFATPHSLFASYSLFASLRGFRELLALFDRFFDRAHHVEGGFRQMIVFAFAQIAEALDGVGEVDELAGRAGEDFGDVEGLRQEAFDLAGARHRDLV